jgi:hypothetical protein
VSVSSNTAMKTKVLITSHQEYDEINIWQPIKKRLIELYEISDKRYELVDDPDEANVILVGSERTDSWGEHIFDNEVVWKFPDKAFTIHDGDYPIFLHHGVYSSNRISSLSHGRIRTGAYTLTSKNKINPFIHKHVSTEADLKRKEYLFSFLGRNSHPIRENLFSHKFKRSDIYIEDTSHFNVWLFEAKSAFGVERQSFYYEILLNSKFALCPRGAGTGSMRLFEAIKLGIPPVILSDGWIPPKGPAWSEFSIFVKEKEFADLEKIVQSYESDHQAMGRIAKAAYDKYFDERVYFNFVVENCLDIMETQKLPEGIYLKLSKSVLVINKTRDFLRIKSRMKKIIGTMRLR